ncbi:cardiolipin synthase [Pilibacter termitis]|uniref:Cardiolipin synthase n=1 Tax=Pilibacter termitis TaxID=263852 RepID=A0A1T4QIQ0_9ENTE|nr:cardiolipin synthase [Pilibacter termitis]SKA03670.1 cardiolipin synthase [Pilibacter termitis]
MLNLIIHFFEIALENIELSIIILDVLLAAIIVFRGRKQTSSIWAWLLVLLFLPVVGFFLYLFLGRGISNTRLFDLKMQNRIGNLEEMRLQQEEVAAGKIPQARTGKVDVSSLVYMLTANEKALYANEATLEIFTDGRAKFDALIQDIRKSKHHIHFQYYIFRMDNLGKEIYQELLKAQKRGVKVRMLLDAWGSNDVKKRHFKELTNLGGRVVFFFPLFLPWINPRLNYRNHRKIVVIDGEVGYTGGFNVGDEYLGKKKKFGYWRDNHLRMTGEGVYSLQNRFIMDWNSQHINEIKRPENYFPPIQKKGDTHLQVITSGPDSEEEQIKMTYLKMINLAKEEILIQTPYYIPDESIHQALKLALISGVKVRMQIPNKPDHPFVYWATYSFAAELLSYGAEIETYEKGFIHAKTMIIDAGIASVGSANIDNRSFQLDFEVNTIIYEEKFAKKLRNAFFQDSRDSKRLTQELYNNRKLFIRFKESLARLISPLL